QKLMLGMVLVAAILALLVAGTEKGLSTLRATMKTLECKVKEVEAVTKLQAEVRTYSALRATEIADRVATARKWLQEYKNELERTQATRHEPHIGFAERDFLPGLERNLDALETVAKEKVRPILVEPDDPDDSPVRKAVGELTRSVDDLSGT